MEIERVKIQKALKSLMKKRGRTYADIGADLGLSEATVKRRLNGPDISLQQIIEFAQSLEISFYELIEISKEQGTEFHLFTEAQEAFLAENLNHMLILRWILMKHSFNEILKNSKLSEAVLRKTLRGFENVALIKMMPNDRIQVVVRSPFKWIPEGRLQKAYGEHTSQVILKRIKEDRGQAGFHKRFEMALTPELQKSFCAELEAVHKKYQGLCQVVLNSRVQPHFLTSGIIFVDQFSSWGEKYD